MDPIEFGLLRMPTCRRPRDPNCYAWHPSAHTGPPRQACGRKVGPRCGACSNFTRPTVIDAALFAFVVVFGLVVTLYA